MKYYPECTLGYAGRLWGCTNCQVLVTAWHCIAFAGTEKTSQYTIIAWGPDGSQSFTQYFILTTGGINQVFASPIWWWQTSWLGDELHMLSDATAIGVIDPGFFSRYNILPGYVMYVNTYQWQGQTRYLTLPLPVVQQLGKYDVTVFSVLTTTKGTRLYRGDYANALGGGTVLSTCWTVPLYPMKGKYGDFVPVVECHMLTTEMGIEEGDSGSPVYQLVYSSNVPTSVKAYGVVSGKTLVGLLPVTIIAPLDQLFVDVTAR